MIREGSYYKVVGGDFGAFFDGHAWHTFDCHGCMIASSRIVPFFRIGLPEVPRKVLKSIKPSGNEFKHDRELHNQWLRDGKPYRKETK